MRIFTNIIGRLHRVFNKDPRLTPVVTFSFNTGGKLSLTVNGIDITCSEGNASVVFTKTTTLLNMVSAINLLPGISASIAQADYGNMLAKGLYEDSFENEGTMQYPTSILWVELKTFAIILQEQSDRISAAEKELYANSADGNWLDMWMYEYFGIKRFDDENDSVFYNRAKYEIITIKINNKALKQLVSDASGYKVDIIDEQTPNLFGVYISSGSINDVSPLQKRVIINAINKYRAAGTFPVYYAPVARLLTNTDGHNTNDDGYVVSPKPSLWQIILVT